MIRSRPYNQKVQGKVERSHKELCRKIYYDTVNLKNKEINWIATFPNYVRVLNELLREELGWHSPFKIRYGQVSNFLKIFNIDTDATVEQESVNPSVPSDRDIQKALYCTKKKRQKSKESDKRMDKRMKEKHDKRYKNEVLQKDDIFLVRLRTARGGKGAP